jgi:ATP-dependent Clp protease protease subunit
MKPIYQLKIKDDNAELFIYGDICSDGYKWNETDVSANDIINQLQSVHAKSIDVYINSYGGEVSQGIAIYNALKRHKAKVTTYVDGFACSIASVIAMAGDTRKMYSNSLLMIHNAWTVAQGNADELEKAAEDLRTVNEATKKAYLDVVNITEEELNTMLDAETWITAEKAVEMGFATEIIAEKKSDKASASAQSAILALLTKAQEEKKEEEEENPPANPEEEEEEPKAENDIEVVIADVVSRLEKLEAEVFKKEKEGEPEKETPEEKNKKIALKFLKAIQK